MKDKTVPEFAVLGHPNEGKSSVVSTLTENDSVVISPTPGETRTCRTFPVIIDNRETIRFIDTPGFQVPQQTLEWFRKDTGPMDSILDRFIAAHQHLDDFRDECELLSPVAGGAGIIYVADGSRPVRRNDHAEMEILRLTARPRMAIINDRDKSGDFSEVWKNEFRKHFNVVRVFNAHNATYRERMGLLTSLKGIDQDGETALEEVIQAFEKDWQHRNHIAAGAICDLLEQCLCFQITKTMNEKQPEALQKATLQAAYQKKLLNVERQTHQQIRKLFKHNIFQVELPPRSLLTENLFSEKNWEVLGLSKRQLVAAAAATGSAAGVALDLAAAGHSLGLFAAIGGALGAGSALMGLDRIAKVKVIGRRISGYRLTIGPHKNIQMLYILLDRALLLYSHVVNWTHGRRGYPSEKEDLQHLQAEKKGFSSHLDNQTKQACNHFFQQLWKEDYVRKETAGENLRQAIERLLESLV